MEAPACRRNRLEPVAAPQLLGIHHLAVEELEDKGVVLRQHRDHGGTDTRLRGGNRIVNLVLPVDREEPGILAGDPHDVPASKGRDLVVRVGQTARKRLDLSLAAELGHLLQDVRQGHRPILQLARLEFRHA